jgi:hypothetical protein
MRAGALYGHPTSGPVTVAPGCSSLPTPTSRDWKGRNQRDDATCLPGAVALLPTPAANQYEMADVDGYLERREREKALGRNGNGFGLVLSMAVKMLPTPAAWDGDRGPDYAWAGREASGADDLVTTIAKLLPTPTSADHKGATSPEAAQDWEFRGTNLPEAVQRMRMLPTPRVTADRASRGSLTRQGHWSAPSLGQAVELAQGILPREYADWTEVQGWHGATTSPPSDDGRPSLDGQLRLPWTDGDG